MSWGNIDPTVAAILDELRRGREAQEREREERYRAMQQILENQNQQMQTLNRLMQQMVINGPPANPEPAGRHEGQGIEIEGRKVDGRGMAMSVQPTQLDPITQPNPAGRKLLEDVVGCVEYVSAHQDSNLIDPDKEDSLEKPSHANRDPSLAEEEKTVVSIGGVTGVQEKSESSFDAGNDKLKSRVRKELVKGRFDDEKYGDDNGGETVRYLFSDGIHIDDAIPYVNVEITRKFMPLFSYASGIVWFTMYARVKFWKIGPYQPFHVEPQSLRTSSFEEGESDADSRPLKFQTQGLKIGQSRKGAKIPIRRSQIN